MISIIQISCGSITRIHECIPDLRQDFQKPHPAEAILSACRSLPLPGTPRGRVRSERVFHNRFPKQHSPHINVPSQASTWFSQCSVRIGQSLFWNLPGRFRNLTVRFLNLTVRAARYPLLTIGRIVLNSETLS